jgi:hypothetical protein
VSCFNVLTMKDVTRPSYWCSKCNYSITIQGRLCVEHPHTCTTFLLYMPQKEFSEQRGWSVLGCAGSCDIAM